MKTTISTLKSTGVEQIPIKEQSAEITHSLEDIFGMTKESASQILTANDDRFELETSNEVTRDELALAKIFGRKEDMLNLQTNEPFTIASVLEEYDNELQMVA